MGGLIPNQLDMSITDGGGGGGAWLSVLTVLLKSHMGI